ncbi:MAG: trypsin-like peptidase domain-containing protein [Lachnospiraceae bacterium]|nr:trypsin-like peptidase domain-containing protein [Lachnospiraceae bacterium]
MEYDENNYNGIKNDINPTTTANTQPAKKKKERKAGRFFGKLIGTVVLGAVFGACAFAAWRTLDHYGVQIFPDKEESADEFDAEKYRSQIEKDILSKLENDRDSKKEDISDNSDEDSTVKTFATDSNVTMRVTDVSEVVDKVMPSVVSITNNYTYVTNYWGMEYSQESEASGSGIIIGENDTELLIATNNHVIEDADKLAVQFIDGEVVEAKVKGADADNDVAVIAVALDEMENTTKDAIEIATLGDSDALKVGEPAIAIGNALGYGQSVTTGVISALNRSIESEDGTKLEGFIQTDAAINPGNSGGALLNVNGEVIGINSNKIGGSTVEGMGYAIPISRALPIIDDLKNMKTKKEIKDRERGYLGISGRGISAEMTEVYGFPEGVYVYEVYEGTGAEEVGLRKGDIIVKFEGSTIKSMEELQQELAYYEAGETVNITVKRVNEDGTYDDVKLEIELVSEDVMPQE